jgi:hypothetical protein
VRGQVLIVFKHLFESIEVERVADVVFVDAAEVSVVFEVAEPADPAVVFLGGVAV